MKIKHINLLRFGVLTTSEEIEEKAEDSLSGYFLYPSSICFLNNSDKIQGVIGLKFGIEYYIEGFANQELDDVVFACKINHPQITNPETGEKATETIEYKHNYLNDLNFDYFFFEYEWEVKKGKWIFQLLENDQVKLEKSFEII